VDAAKDDVHLLRLCSVFEIARGVSSSRGYDAVGGLQIHAARLTAAMDRRGLRQTVLTAYRPGAPRIEHLGMRTRLIRVGAPIRRFRQLYAIAALHEIKKIAKVDLVHVHLGEDLAISPLGLLAASRTRAPLVATVHCSLANTVAPHDARSALLRVVGGPLQSSLLQRASAILVLSRRIAEAIVDLGIEPSRVRMIPVGIDLPGSEPTPRPQAMQGRRWVVYAGRLVPEKGVRELVRAFEMVSVPDAGLLVVGDGSHKRSLEDAARRTCGDRVRFVGPKPHSEVRAYLRHADVVVMPSRYEERGRVLLEAMAEGTPVVGSRTGGILDTIQDGENGLLVGPGDSEGLARAIDRVLADDRFAASIGQAGKITASKHGVSALADATLAAYRDTLGHRFPREVSVR
jgi:glycogen(starch) synthase